MLLYMQSRWHNLHMPKLRANNQFVGKITKICRENNQFVGKITKSLERFGYFPYKSEIRRFGGDSGE